MPASAFGNLDVAQLTDVGLKRSRNEDSCRMAVPPAGAPEAKHGALFIVADGMGGLGGGDVASKAAIDELLRNFYSPQNTEPDPILRLEDSLEVANRYVRDQAGKVGLARIGSTGAGILLKPNGEVVAFNVGDCRVYRLRDGRIARISRDQSVMQRQIDLGMSEEEAKSARSSQVTAFLGQREALKPFTMKEHSQPGDVYLICSDGLWGLVDDADLLRAVNGVPARKAVEKLIRLARAAGGNDNITAMLVRIGGVPGAVGRLLLPIALAVLLVAAGILIASLIGGQAQASGPSATQTFQANLTQTIPPTVAPSATPQPPAATPTMEVIQAQFSATPSPTLSLTPTFTATLTASYTASYTATYTPSVTPSHTLTATATPTASITSSPTLSATPTTPPTETATVTASLTASMTLTASHTPSRTPTATENRPPTTTLDPALILTLFTATPTPSHTPTASRTPTPTRTPTLTPTLTNTFTTEEAATATQKAINAIIRRRTQTAQTATAEFGALQTKQAELKQTQDAIDTLSPPDPPPPDNPEGGN